MKLVYVAGPMERSEQNIWTSLRNAFGAANELVDRGFIPFVPHLYFQLALLKDRPIEQWLEMDLEMVGKCDALLRLRGQSRGATAEVERARELGIPVYFSVEELVEGEGD